MAKPSPVELAQVAYAAYGESTGGVNFRGEPMPAWDGLGQTIQHAWVAAASAVEADVIEPTTELLLGGPDPMAARIAALSGALELHRQIGDLHLQCGVDRNQTIADAELAVRRTADTFVAWLHGTVRLRLVPGPVVDQSTGEPTGTPNGGENMTQLNTGQKFTVGVDTEDAAGYDTPESIVWSIDNPGVATLVIAEDTRSVEVISGAPGSAVLTASIPALELSATLAVDVVPAGTATITLVAGDPVDE